MLFIDSCSPPTTYNPEKAISEHSTDQFSLSLSLSLKKNREHLPAQEELAMADASGCDGFNHSVAAEEKEMVMETEMPLTQKEEDEEEEEDSVLDSAQETTAGAPEQLPPSADLEAKKQRLLEELESALLPSNTKGKPTQESCKQVLPPAPPSACIGLGLGLGFEVIDETALVETLSLPPPSASAAAAAAAPSGKNVKKQSSSRRRAKKDAFKHKTGNGNGKKTAAASEEAPNPNANGNGNGKKNKNKTKTRKYSRNEMEALRFANVEKQRAFWNAIRAGLEAVVSSEYDTLLAVPTLPLPAPLCQLPNKKHAAPPILSAACCENMDGELQAMENTEMGSNADPSCSHSLNSKDEASVFEECSEDDDSDADYASIQRPAFLVDGEPNFDSGPPEDGWEYLRRVRWEADQIPRVKVVKLDRSKLNKEQSDYMPKIPDIAKCPEHLLPLKEWEDVFLAEFSALRANLSCLEGPDARESNNLQPFHMSKQHGYRLKESAGVMNMDVPLDHHLSATGQLLNMISEVKDTKLPWGSKSCVDKPSSSSSSPMPPLLSAILGMDPVARVSMLLKRISMLSAANTVTRNDCTWLFALCATVDAPLDADSCAALRSLLRKCASIRAGKAELDDEVIMLNILATISGRYFGQSES